MAIMQGGLVGPLVKRFGEKRLAVNSLLLQALAFTGTALSSSFVHIARKMLPEFSLDPG